ncbi:hypothetical protein LguiB_004361 [Lonicera macranthoides]
MKANKYSFSLLFMVLGCIIFCGTEIIPHMFSACLIDLENERKISLFVLQHSGQKNFVYLAMVSVVEG